MTGEPDWLARGRGAVWLPYTQMKTTRPPLPVVKAEDMRLHLADGRTLIDGVGSWWTVVHGYNHPHIRAAVEAQLARFPHVMLGGLAHEAAWTLARRLADMLPGDLNHTFFSDSGSVAVEVAMKMAVQFWINSGVKGRTRFLSFKGGYHGDTFATMAVCDPDEGMHALFKGAIAEQIVVGLPVDEATTRAYEAALAQHGESLAAVLVEPLVQGAGGMKMHDAATLKRIADLARAAGVLVIFDEIFVGFGRTGTLFAMEAADVAPDIVTLGKALTGGFLPLAATVATTRLYESFLDDSAAKALMHGPTYMGNALACAAANASLDLFASEPRLAQVAAIEGWLREGLSPARALQNVRDVRIKGAIGCIEMEKIPDLNALKNFFIERGAFLRPFGNILYTTPSYTASRADVTKLCAALVAGAGL